jgi:hypothetical protein
MAPDAEADQQRHGGNGAKADRAGNPPPLTLIGVLVNHWFRGQVIHDKDP